jgi:[acyl-carrier-protein] S-malonyltransferase
MHRIPMIFPGQASQSVGMAADLATGAGAAASFLGRIDDILQLDLTGIMTAGPADLLTETRNAQPAILAHSVAVVLALREMGIVPSLVAGHSLGEFSAAVAAGALDSDDALKIVRARGELMFAAGLEKPGSMAAVMGLSAEAVANVCRAVSGAAGMVCLANHNSAEQTVISGNTEAVSLAGPALLAAGAKRVIPLPVSGAFHSPLLAEAGRRFADRLAGIDLMDLAVPLIANVSARPVTTAAELRTGFREQMTAPVRWHETMERIAHHARAAEPPRLILEIGPGRVLTNLGKRAYPDIHFAPVGAVADLDKILDIIAGSLT